MIAIHVGIQHLICWTEQLVLKTLYKTCEEMTQNFTQKFISNMNIREIDIMSNNALISEIFMDTCYTITLIQ